MVECVSTTNSNYYCFTCVCSNIYANNTNIIIILLFLFSNFVIWGNNYSRTFLLCAIPMYVLPTELIFFCLVTSYCSKLSLTVRDWNTIFYGTQRCMSQLTRRQLVRETFTERFCALTAQFITVSTRWLPKEWKKVKPSIIRKRSV